MPPKVCTARRIVHVLLALSLAIGIPALAQSPSNSKISAHLINAFTVGGSNIIAGHPRVLKILDLNSDMLRAARAYKAGTPAGKVILRIYTSTSYPQSASASVSASNFWNSVLQPPLNALSASDRALIDYVEGPNEGDSTPTWQSLQSAQWLSTFWQTLSPLIAAAGFKPCLGSIAVGNPPGTPSQMQTYIGALVPALRQAKNLGGAWSYHAYTINYVTDAGVESYYSLRYRQFYSYFASYYPDLLTMPLILTEAGVDQNGTPSTSGWQARGSAGDFERWLNWFDRQLAQDNYVLGCTLFQLGNPGGWSSFDLEPIAHWLGSYLTTPTNLPLMPNGFTGVATNATALLKWTAIPLNPITYNVKRSRTSGGPYTTIATNITEGVTATTYTDTTVTNGGVYHYVITAVNAVGEGPISTQITVTMPNITLPDVVVTAITWTPNPAFAGTNVTFRATVKNQGTGPTPAGVVLGVGFSIDDGPNVSWSGSYTAALAPGATVVLASDGGPTGKSTWAATPGPHTLRATADDINRFAEKNEGNNWMTIKVPISTGRPKVGSITCSTNNIANFAFSATSGLQYRIQYKNDLNELPWQNLSSDLTANSNSVSVSIGLTNQQRFYRVLQLE